jgi:uncharacterized protein (DUF58 family)
VTWTRALRVSTLVLAPVAATAGSLYAKDDKLITTAAPVLVVMWMIMASTILLRLLHETRRRAAVPDGRRWPWDHFDVLTATGATTMWTSAVALTIASLTGWASVSLLGVLGLGAMYVVATWTAIIAGGAAPWQHAKITRTIVPEIAVEGDSLREEIRLSGVRIPYGMRLFATGRTTRHGVITRYAVGAEASGVELKLESDLGGAVRGEHQAPAMTLWLGDTLGLTRTPIVRRGTAAFTVLPRPGVVDGARGLLGHGGDDAMSRPTLRQPTEGSFRIRDYVPGDDSRRIHWVRSLQADRLIMRLPDEVPPADPAVRVVLDTELGELGELTGIDDLTCRAPHQLLDALVHVWLGIGNSLMASGTRVTLVAAAHQGDRIAAVERKMIARAPREVLKLGARVAWQAQVPLAALLARSPERQVVVSCRPRQLAGATEPLWVVVPESAWTSAELWSPMMTAAMLPFPIGSDENRLGRRRRERNRILRMKLDRAVFSQVVCWSDWTAFPGNYLARPDQGRVSLAVI